MDNTEALRDDWLEQLEQHSIFDLPVAEGKKLRDLRSGKQLPSSIPIQPAQSFGGFSFGKPAIPTTVNTSLSLSQQRRTQLLALRGNDLFLAVGSRLRVLNLTEFKNAWLDATEESIKGKLNSIDVSSLLHMPYKELETPGIDFDIDMIVPNLNGALLAVAGEQKLAVICLPRKGFSSHDDPSMAVLSHQTVHCKTFLIGTQFYTKATRILKIEWHPLSEARTHLMVLSNDCMLCMFDIATNTDEPEQQFDLAASHRKSTSKASSFGISADDELSDEEEVATFTLGGSLQDSDGWESFAVYYALKNGHIYALCPVLPFKSTVRKQHLESLACVAMTNCKKILADSENKDNINPFYYYFRLQFQWLCDMMKSAQEGNTSHSLLDDNRINIQTEKTSFRLRVQPQGPFVVQHELQRDSSRLSIYVSDILLLRSNSLDIVALAFNNGTIGNYILAGGIGGQWLMPLGKWKSSQQHWYQELSKLQSSTHFLPRASLYEVVRFDKPQLSDRLICLVKDPLFADTYYAYHAAGIHSISTKPWVEHLLKLKKRIQLSDASEAELADFAKKEISSQVQCLVNTAPFEVGSINPTIGAVIINDTFLSYSLLSLDANYRLRGVDLNLCNVLSRSSTLNDVITEDSLADNAQKDDLLSAYPSVLSQLDFEAPKTLNKVLTQSAASKVVIPPELGGSKEVVITKETLHFLSTTATKIRQDILEVTKSVTDMTTRLELQKSDYERQVEMLHGLYQRALKFRTGGTSDSMAKIEAARKRHTELSCRIYGMLRDISSAKQLGLSHMEQEWIDKLDIIKEKSKTHLQREESLKLHVESYRESKRKEASPTPSKATLSSSQAEIVTDTLELLTEVINDIEARVKSLTLEQVA